MEGDEVFTLTIGVRSSVMALCRRGAARLDTPGPDPGDICPPAGSIPVVGTICWSKSLVDCLLGKKDVLGSIPGFSTVWVSGGMEDTESLL